MTGTVVDENDLPVIGANVLVKNTVNGVTTGVDGKYSISLDNGGGVLVFSFLGYVTQEVAVAGRTSVDIKLLPDSEQVEEVVVVGYGTQKKASVVGAISTVDVANLKFPSSNLSTNLAGNLAGVISMTRSGEPGKNGAADFYIRGISSFQGTVTPLVLVDGVERDIDLVDTDDIESFSILKDASASAVYGVRGANGVILITTKKGNVGRPEIKVRAEAGITQPTVMPRFVDSEQWARMYNEASGTQRYTPEQIAMYRDAYNASTGAVSAGNGTGAIGKFNVWASTADDPADADYVLLTDEPLDLRMAGGYQKAVLPSPAQSAKWVKLEVLEGSGDNGVEGGFVTPAEIEFFASPKAALDEAMLEVFTDLSCSELREGVTRTEITRLYGLSAFVAQEAAMRLMNGTYDPFEKEFRAATYLPYSDNNLNRRLLTKKYSRMDNPTGIEVKPGEKLIVCVDKVPAGQRLSLAVFGEAANGYGPNYGGMAEADQYETVDQEVTLTAGLNAVDITAAGMCYVMNTAAALSSASEAVKVHILPTCGTVHGYFDLERHRTDERYVELLARTGYKYFVAKGRKMIFNFHTSQLRADAPTGIVSGLTAWDDIVTWQQELMGIDGCDYFNNHIMAVSTTDPDAYMDASNRRVSFSTSALHKIISREQLNALEDNTWGPAHELGHVNQGAINWKSTTESSNNLFSNYAIYKMGKYESRGDALSELALSWFRQETWVLMGASTHQGEDTEAHMRMNWQLWNYYHRCGYNERFFPVLFELLRQDPLPSEYSAAEDPGASQLKFAEKACDAAQEDLTEFFETWGFYRPVDIAYEQYGSARYRVTEAMIRESKARIAAKGYPKAAPIQYLEDRKVKNGTLYSDMGHFDTYRNKTQITKTPSFTLSGRTYTVADCDQAVAVELRKPASGETLGELLYFSNLATFTVPDGVNLAGAELYAVQYDGVRKPVR
ncbi:M60 family metallopeptidase [uncultured Alistipes sp.]|uniref:M60 family metallopeptidase n=1 Tax=uncultured Alistipes sp. TaxID=538949 RepID=UPI003451C691